MYLHRQCWIQNKDKDNKDHSVDTVVQFGFRSDH